MKVNVSRLFDVAQVATTKAYQELQSFVDNQVSVNDNFYRILLNGISLGDNVSGTFVTVDVQHLVPTTIGLSKVPIGVIVLNTQQLTPFVIAVNYTRLKDNQYSVVGLLSDPTQQASVKANLYFFHQ